MAQATWQVNLDGHSHTVTLNWTYFGGEREVLVDGKVVNEDRELLRWNSDQEFPLDGRRCRVATRPQAANVTAFDVELYVDNTLIETQSDTR